MAEQVVSDLIMKFVGDSGAIKGETRTTLDTSNDRLCKDFVADKMFEVETFSVKTGIVGSGGETDPAKLAETMKAQQKAMEEAARTGKPPKFKNSKGLDFTEFRAGQTQQYPVDLKPFEMTRSIDISSGDILKYCIGRKIFESATLIKRKAAGGKSSGKVFLRLDFTEVLIKQVEWSEDDPVKETIEFVCRALTVRYAPQLPDGTLGAAKVAFWSAVDYLSEAPIG